MVIPRIQTGRGTEEATYIGRRPGPFIQFDELISREPRGMSGYLGGRLGANLSWTYDPSVSRAHYALATTARAFSAACHAGN